MSETENQRADERKQISALRWAMQAQLIQHQQCWTALHNLRDAIRAAALRSEEGSFSVQPGDLLRVVEGIDNLVEQTDPHNSDATRKILDRLMGLHPQLVTLPRSDDQES